ncbi:MAG: hypothetical protein ACKO8Q_04500 [Bacteroidota bacterium]
MRKTHKFLFFLITFFIFQFSFLEGHSQYAKNLLQEKCWWNYGAGATTADNISYQLFASRTNFGELVSTTTRYAYSQEFIEGKDDSIFFRKNRNLEFGVLWGNGWAHKNIYLHVAAGMGLNVRLFGDSAQQVINEFDYKVGMTIGVPAQIELGYNKKTHGVSLLLTGNWNFREPYLGALICYTRRFKPKSK